MASLNLRSRSRNPPPSPSMAKLHVKLVRIISRKDQLKLSFTHLKSQIKNGLIEAEDVFRSLAVPLMKLVDLKSTEMAEEGRSSTIFMKINDEGEDMVRVDTHKATSTAERDCDIHRFEEEEYTNKAIMAGNELLHKHKMQLMQLVQLLKQVESCVNSSQKNMFRNIDGHKDNIRSIVQKAFTYVSSIQQSSSDGHAFDITRNLLKVIYVHVCEALNSVEGGVNNLTNTLAEQMCKPMIEYVKSVKKEITSGTCPRLFNALEDMKGAVSDGRVELEQARKRVRVAEERRLETLSMLKESEEKMKKMRQYLDFVINDKKESAARNKLLAPQVDQSHQTKDDKLMWDLLKKKQTCQQPESPFGPKELLPVGISTKHHRPAMAKPSITHRPTTRSNGKLKTLLPLGVSPSVTERQVLSRRRIRDQDNNQLNRRHSQNSREFNINNK